MGVNGMINGLTFFTMCRRQNSVSNNSCEIVTGPVLDCESGAIGIYWKMHRSTGEIKCNRSCQNAALMSVNR